MSHFDNPNRIRFVTTDKSSATIKLGIPGGSFVEFQSGEPEDVTLLGTQIQVIPREVRPVAIQFEPKFVTHDPDSRRFQWIVNMCESGRFTEGCYGLEFAVEYNGRMFIMPFCSKTLRNAAQELLQTMDRRVLLMPVKVETRHYSWWTLESWVPTSVVQSYKKQHTYSDDNEWDGTDWDY